MKQRRDGVARGVSKSAERWRGEEAVRSGGGQEGLSPARYTQQRGSALLALVATGAAACGIACSSTDQPQEEGPVARQSQALVLDALQTYAQECDLATGTTVPDFNCDVNSTLVPTTNHGTNPSSPPAYPSGSCDQPNRLNQVCDPGSKFQVLTNTASAYVVAHCRKKGQGPGIFGDIAVIQHNKLTGATCFYQSVLQNDLNGAVKAPSAGQDAWRWKSPSAAATQDVCASCHDNGPIIRSPYLAQLPDNDPNKLPGARDNNFNKDQPYFFVGRDFASWKTFKVETPNPTCNTCHRMGASNLPSASGTSLVFGIRATATSEVNKNPHSAASPIWMTPGQIDRSSTAERIASGLANAASAQTYANCAARRGERPLPKGADCRITLTTKGSLAAATANPAGFRRSDGYNVVMQRGADQHILELALDSDGWYLSDLFVAIGAPLAAGSADPASYVRSDNFNAVVYRASDNHVYELALKDGWSVSDLSGMLGAPNAAGNPAGYTRSDGFSTVVYRANSHIHELALDPAGSGWSWNDLSAITGAVNANGDPVPFVRADRTNSILYRGSNSHLMELSINGGTWSINDLTLVVGGSNIAGNPSGYVRADGMSAIVVRGANGHIYEYALVNDVGWVLNDLTGASNLAAGDPAPYVRTDVTDAVLYRSSDGHIHELTHGLIGGWVHNDMTALGGLPNASADPFGYVRSDMINAVVFRTSDNHVHELSRSTGGWGHADLTAIAFQ